MTLGVGAGPGCTLGAGAGAGTVGTGCTLGAGAGAGTVGSGCLSGPGTGAGVGGTGARSLVVGVLLEVLDVEEFLDVGRNMSLVLSRTGLVDSPLNASDTLLMTVGFRISTCGGVGCSCCWG